jgi:hypothetical protein
MATSMPRSPGGKLDFPLPVPPPLLHTRSGNEPYDRPRTPVQHGFTSPSQTPQGSPSKHRMPPGANDLPNVFDNAMKLMPTGPTKGGRQQLTPNSPNKNSLPFVDDSTNNFDESVIFKEHTSILGSPTRQSNKENTPSGVRPPYTPNQAAVSRQEPYQRMEQGDRRVYNPQRGLTAEELEKLQLPKVKRLANVTQLCMVPKNPLILKRARLIALQISLITILTFSATSITARAGKLSFKRRTHRLLELQTRNMMLHYASTWAGNERTCANVAQDSVMATSKSLRRSDKVATDRCIWRKRKTRRKCVR